MKTCILGLGFLALIGLQSTASASYSSDCAEFLSSHFTTITDAAFNACSRVDNPYALACFNETSHLSTITDGTFAALPRCSNQYAVNAIHELFTRFNNISDGAVWYVAGTYNPSAATCLDGLASHFSQIDDAAFAACSN